MRKDLTKRIYSIKRLAAMPHVLTRLLSALATPDVSINKLSEIIENDQALTAKVLSLANSAFYGFSQEVTTIKRAATLIGMHELELLALGAGFGDFFNMKKTPERFNGRALWQHCLAVSWLSKELATVTGSFSPSEVMVAGLLHDLGKLVLICHLKEEMEEVLALTDQGVSPHEAERRLGVEHTRIGALLARRWNLPALLQEAIAKHHNPTPSDPFYASTSLVFLGDYMAHKLGFGLAAPPKGAEPDGHFKANQLNQINLKPLLNKAKENVPDRLQMVGSMVNI